MAKILANDLKERQKGHLIKVDEWNALVRAFKGLQSSTLGGTAEGYSVVANRRKVNSRGVHVQTTETIPPFSIFSGTSESPSAFDEPMLLRARKIGITEPGPHGLLLTNGQIQIEANTQGVAKIINYGDVTRLKFTGTTPKIGHFVGPEIDGYEVTVDEQYGLVVVGLVDDDDDDKVEVVRSHEPCGLIGEVVTEISQYDPDTQILGSGTIRLDYRNPSTDVLIEGKDPGTPASGWDHNVFSLCDHDIAVGVKVKVSYVMGIGLVVDAECTEGAIDPSLLWCFTPGTSEAGDDAIDSIQGIRILDIGDVGRAAGPKYDFAGYASGVYFNSRYRRLGLDFNADFTFTVNVDVDVLGVNENKIFSTNAWELYITGSGDSNPSVFEVGVTNENPTSFKITDNTALSIDTTFQVSVRWDFENKTMTLRVAGNETEQNITLPLLDSKDFEVAFGRDIDYTADSLDGQVGYFKWYCRLLSDAEVDAEDGDCGFCSSDGSESGTAAIESSEEQRSALFSLSTVN